jgi:hypothetical protein
MRLASVHSMQRSRARGRGIVAAPFWLGGAIYYFVMSQDDESDHASAEPESVVPRMLKPVSCPVDDGLQTVTKTFYPPLTKVDREADYAQHTRSFKNATFRQRRPDRLARAWSSAYRKATIKGMKSSRRRQWTLESQPCSNECASTTINAGFHQSHGAVAVNENEQKQQ